MNVDGAIRPPLTGFGFGKSAGIEWLRHRPKFMQMTPGKVLVNKCHTPNIGVDVRRLVVGHCLVALEPSKCLENVTGLAVVRLPAPIIKQVVVEFIDLLAETHPGDPREEKVSLQRAQNARLLDIVGTHKDFEQGFKGGAILLAPTICDRIEHLRRDMIGISAHQQDGLVSRDKELAKAKVA